MSTGIAIAVCRRLSSSGVLALDSKGGDAMYVTYEGLIAFGIFIVSIIGLCAKLLKK